MRRFFRFQVMHGFLEGFLARLVGWTILGSLGVILAFGVLGIRIGGFGATLLFVAYQVVGLCLALVVTVLAWRRLTRADVRAKPLPKSQSQRLSKISDPPIGRLDPTVCVCVPSFNEKVGIIATVSALLDQTTPINEIILVDDGSEDGTIQVLQQKYGLLLEENLGDAVLFRAQKDRRIRVAMARRGGKAAALNRGLALADSDLFVTVDADTVLARDALAEILAVYARDPLAVAVAGVVIPLPRRALQVAGRWRYRLPRTALALYQTIDYALDFAWRLGWETANGAHVMSGCATSFRKDLLVQIGGFRATTVTEDYEVIHRLRRWCAENDRPHRILTAPRARVFTEASATLSALMRQRIRWFHGFLQTQIAYCRLIGRYRYGWFGTLTLPVKTIDAASPGMVTIALCGFFLCLTGDATVNLGLVIIGTLGARLAIDCAVGATALALRQGAIAPFFNWQQTAVLALALPPYYVVNRSLWLLIGLCAYWRLFTGSHRW
ncbi:MAG: glycosyltransferase family 2 protein [Pseudomonadota bacterium]